MKDFFMMRVQLLLIMFIERSLGWSRYETIESHLCFLYILIFYLLKRQTCSVYVLLHDVYRYVTVAQPEKYLGGQIFVEFKGTTRHLFYFIATLCRSLQTQKFIRVDQQAKYTANIRKLIGCSNSDSSDVHIKKSSNALS